ncbi:MAG: hypothetical protein HDQ87_02080 [Clostridia bacterium]|nr:hypothetical protein [Clostridia bacterium]
MLQENEGDRIQYVTAAEYEDGRREDSSTMRLIVLELPKAKHLLKKPVAQMSLLDKWIVVLRYAAGRKYREIVNEVIRSEEALSMAADKLLKISQDDIERALFRSRRKYEADRRSDVDVAESIGRAKGIEIGYERSRDEQGIETVRAMLQDGEPAEKII